MKALIFRETGEPTSVLKLEEVPTPALTSGEALDRVLTQTLQNRILPFDEEAARAYGRLVSRARAAGRTIQVADGQIAAIAAVHGFVVATRDVGPFEAAGVGVVNPWEA